MMPEYDAGNALENARFDLQFFADESETVVDEGTEGAGTGEDDGTGGEAEPDWKAEAEKYRKQFDHQANELGELRKMREGYESLKELKETDDILKSNPALQQEFDQWAAQARARHLQGRSAPAMSPELAEKIQQLEERVNESDAKYAEQMKAEFKVKHKDVTDEDMDAIDKIVVAHNFDSYEEAYRYHKSKDIEIDALKKAVEMQRAKAKAGVIPARGVMRAKGGGKPLKDMTSEERASAMLAEIEGLD